MLDKRFSSIKGMQMQLFHVLVIAATLANMCGFLLNAFLQRSALPTQMCVICGIAILVFGFWGASTKHKDGATIGILVTVMWIEFPFLYSVYSHVILVYFVLSILGITIFYPRKFSIPFCVLTMMLNILVIVATYFLPKNMYSIDEGRLLVFTICSYLIAAVAVFVVINVVILRYERQKKELSDMNAQLHYLANHDSLTMLYNRGYLMKELDRRIQMDNVKLLAILLDVDDFKQINDTFGHSFGDKVLITLAYFLEKEVEGKGFAARFGGEEFLIIFDHDNQELALRDLQHLAAQLEEHFQKEKQISVTFSGGLERYSDHKKVDELIINADKKLYQAKRNGKNQIIC